MPLQSVLARKQTLGVSCAESAAAVPNGHAAAGSSVAAEQDHRGLGAAPGATGTQDVPAPPAAPRVWRLRPHSAAHRCGEHPCCWVTASGGVSIRPQISVAGGTCLAPTSTQLGAAPGLDARWYLARWSESPVVSFSDLC